MAVQKATRGEFRVTARQIASSNSKLAERLTGEVEVDDDELLRRCQRGDDSALGDLVQRYQDRIFRLAFRVLGDAARAEEAAADALSVVWSRCRTWRGDSRAGTWIHQVAWRVVRDHHRSRKRWWRFWELDGETSRQAAGTVIEPSAAATEDEERTVRAERVARALAALSPEDRALIHLHYYEEQSLAEIAPVLKVSRDALKMRLARAREKLRASLGERDEPA
jgi:RNA polymerase sigma-70 factor, ECF subfamily